MNKKIKFILILQTFVLLFIFSSFLNQAFARHSTTDLWHRIDICPGSDNPGTYWQIRYRIELDNAGGNIGWTTWRTLWVNDTTGANPCWTAPDSAWQYYDFGWLSPTYTPRMQWWHACVDPIVNTSENNAAGGIAFSPNITCKRGTGSNIYIMCDQGSPNYLGYVYWDDVCPICNGTTECCYSNTFWTCPSTRCTSSSQTQFDSYCTYQSGPRCDYNPLGACTYSYTNTFDSRCGSTCNDPNLRVTAFTYPGGDSGGNATATVTIENTGPTGTGSSFDVAVIRNRSSATCSTDGDVAATCPNCVSKVATSALAAGASRTLSITVTQPSNAGSYTAVAMVDADCNIAERWETDNDRSDAYTITSIVRGNVYDDVNRNGIKDTGEGNKSGITTTLTNSSGGSVTRVTDANGNYDFGARNAGSYTVRATVPSDHIATTTNPVSISLGADQTVNFGITVRSYTLTINVYQDLNGNGVDDGGSETGYSGASVTVSGQGAGTYTTNANGQIVVSENVFPGNSTITLAVPSGFRSTTTNPRTTTFPPNQTVNFGIQPPAPTCTSLTTNRSTVNPGQTATLTCNSPSTAAQGVTLTYTWYPGTVGTITSTNPSTTPTATWTSPNPYWTDTYTYPTVNVCITGTVLCRPYAISNGLGINNSGIHIVPLFSVTGNVFVDQNKDSLQNGGDVTYNGGISINPNPAGVTVTYPSPGNYVINNMPGGQYTISYTSLPSGYVMTYPKNGPPPSFTVRVGNVSTGGACSVSGHNTASCDINGNITTLRYGISNSIPWIQSTGGDITGNDVTDPTGGGFTNQIPAGASCGPYVSLIGSGGTPGVIYIGAGSANFGSGQASPNPYNWIVGGLTYPDIYIPSTPGLIRTSYSYMRSLASQSNLTPVDIANYCGAGGISNCTLSSSLPNGLYISNGDLTLTGASYTFPANRNFVILVNGNLNIRTEVHVPVGSTAFFTTSGDINVASNVGEAVITSTRSNVEGYFSTDRSFYAQGLNACPTVDRRLNVAGSIVVNASLTGGSFVNQRDLCAGDLQCPVFMVIERPDFVLNSPEFLKSGRRVWREIAP